MMALKALDDRRSCYGVTPTKKEFYKELFFSKLAISLGLERAFYLSFCLHCSRISEVLKKVCLFGDGLSREEG